MPMTLRKKVGDAAYFRKGRLAEPGPERPAAQGPSGPLRSSKSGK
jgi:hypothetical protein